jgi:hypothetical protein
MPLIQRRIRHHDPLHERGRPRNIDDGPRRRGGGQAVQRGHVLTRQCRHVTDDPAPSLVGHSGSRRNGERHGAGRRRLQQVQPQQPGRGVVTGYSLAGPGARDRGDVQCVP